MQHMTLGTGVARTGEMIVWKNTRSVEEPETSFPTAAAADRGQSAERGKDRE